MEGVIEGNTINTSAELKYLNQLLAVKFPFTLKQHVKKQISNGKEKAKLENWRHCRRMHWAFAQSAHLRLRFADLLLTWVHCFFF